jgi:mRNA interferase RelE/StbE
VTVGETAAGFIKRLSLVPRRVLKKALKDLGAERGDIRSLEQELAGCYRLRVGKYRVIVRHGESGSIDVLFVEERRIVYEVFEEQFAKKLRS